MSVKATDCIERWLVQPCAFQVLPLLRQQVKLCALLFSRRNKYKVSTVSFVSEAACRSTFHAGRSYNMACSGDERHIFSCCTRWLPNKPPVPYCVTFPAESSKITDHYLDLRLCVCRMWIKLSMTSFEHQAETPLTTRRI